MRVLICIFLYVSTALAQAGKQTSTLNQPASVDFYSKQAAIQRRGVEALKLEETRRKSGLCTNAEEGGQSATAACLVKEGKTTEQNYLNYIRSIGALLRLPGPGTESESPRSQKSLAFDHAEEAWQTYREQSCKSMSAQWEGGDQQPVAYANCLLTTTWNHMQELSELYSDLWH
jgi:uncharacterized protein YecT (DUF1311 family)